MDEREYQPFPNQEWRNELQARVEIPLAMRLLQVPRGGRVLEVGCGRGVALPRLAEILEPSALAGVDRAGELLREAQERCTGARIEATLVCGDVRALPFDAATFDVVIDFGTCYHVRGGEAALAEVERVLAPGGVFMYESPLSQVIAHPGRSTRKRLPWSAAFALEPLERAGLWCTRVKRGPGAEPLPRAGSSWWQWPLLAASIALFLWMFIASDAFAGAVEGSPAAGEAPGAAAQEGVTFAHDWRHGQAGWPVFTPGFFLTAVAVNLALRRRGFGRFAIMFASAAGVGVVVAYHFADVGSAYLAVIWAARTGAEIDMGGDGARVVSPLIAGATLLAWVLLMAASRKAVASRAWWPLAVPALAYVGVAGLRSGGFAFGDLSGVWFERLARADGTAIVSSVLAVAMAAVFLADAWRDGAASRRRIANVGGRRGEMRQPLA